jgi:hypothetical protein
MVRYYLKSDGVEGKHPSTTFVISSVVRNLVLYPDVALFSWDSVPQER